MRHILEFRITFFIILIATSLAFKLNDELSPESKVINGEPMQSECDPCDDYGDCTLNINNDLFHSPGNSTFDGVYAVTDAKLIALSEKLIRMDTIDNVAKDIIVKSVHPFQNTVVQSTSPLLTIPEADLNKLTITKLKGLFGVYDPEVHKEESFSDDNKAKIKEFVKIIYETPIMEEAVKFLKAEVSTYKDEDFEKIWFTPYSRDTDTKKLGSCGFEHVFFGEVKPKDTRPNCRTKVVGFHNWVYYHAEQNAAPSRIEYFGTNTSISANKGSPVGWSISENKFNWVNPGTNTGIFTKASTSMFIGTSPELELALYTVCFVARLRQNCPVSFYGHSFKITTFGMPSNTLGPYVGAAFPNIMLFK